MTYRVVNPDFSGRKKVGVFIAVLQVEKTRYSLALPQSHLVGVGR